MTSKNPIKPPVVAQVPKTGVTTWTPPNPDKNWSSVAKQYNMPQGYITATSDPTGSRNKAYLNTFNVDQPGPQAGAVDPFGSGGIQSLITSLRNSGGSGSSTAAADRLARDKFNAEQAANATATATALRALQGLQGRLASGGYRGNADTLLDLISGRSTTGQAAITGLYDTDVSNINDAFGVQTGQVNDAYNTETGYANDIYNTGVANATNTYNTGVGNINAGFDTGQGMINSGYGELDAFLNANQINPYANLQQQSGPVNNAMANYLSAYGVSNDPVSQQVQASQISNQEGADSFNQLQQLMSANQLANNQSNIDVSQMAKNYATTGLGAQRSRYLGNAEAARTEALNSFLSSLNDAMYSAGTSRTAGLNAAGAAQTSGLNTAGSQRTSALNELAQIIAGEQFNVEKDVGTAKTDLENAIITAGGAVDGSTAGAGVNAQPVVTGSATSRAEQIAAAPDNYPNFKAALADLNPNYKFTTMAAAKKKFPSLANAF
jgi:hypothetical protein